MNHDIDHWLKHTIVGLNLCPFAKEIVGTEQFPHFFSPAQTEFEAQDKFLEVIGDMVENTLPSALIVFEDWDVAFEDFNEFTQAMNELLEDLELSDQMMAIVFHPQFQLADAPFESFAHWPNSSPVPLIHILSHAEIERVASLVLGKEISRVNEERIKNMSEAQRREHWPWKF